MTVASEPTSRRFGARRIDYLGFLGTKLRDLRGYATLAHELIQNADDVRSFDGSPGATEMTFIIGEDALVVDNNGSFSDCGQAEEPDCPWESGATGHLCDFHSFRLVASGNKRELDGTSGAFGIGFTAVYQITDRPELISGGRHWIVDETRPEHERVEFCDGCAQCRDTGIPHTRFVFPWARDSASALRKALRAEAITADNIEALAAEVEQALPTALLFLKNLDQIVMQVQDERSRAFSRIRDGRRLLVIADGSEDEEWLLLSGDFAAAAAALRREHPRIEAKRASGVALAIPFQPAPPGVFCAFLPTQRSTELPFHVNADFYPTSDRKDIRMESDYQGAWNQAALVAAARTLSREVPSLRDELGHERLWQLIWAVYEIGRAQPGSDLAVFWRRLEPALASAEYVFTSTGQWRHPSNVVMLETADEEEALPVLHELEIAVVDPSLRRYMSLLRRQGVQLLDIDHIADRLEALGLAERTPIASAPEPIRAPERRRLLWREVERLLKRIRVSEQLGVAKRRLGRCAPVCASDGALWPCGEVHRADAVRCASSSRLTLGTHSSLKPRVRRTRS